MSYYNKCSLQSPMECERKRKRSDSVLWHKPLHPQKNPTRGPKGHISCTWSCHYVPPFWRIGQGGHPVFSDRPKKHKLGRGRWDLSSCQVLLNSFQRFQRRSRKCLSQSEARAAILFSDQPKKNTNLVEIIEILLPAKFRWIPFSGFRGEVENVSANQRPGQPSCFCDRPKKHKLGRGRWDLASCQVSLNSVQRFQRRSRKCLSQSEARAAILFFRSAQKTQTW